MEWSQLAQSRCSNVVSTFAERLNNVVIDVVSTFFCELVGGGGNVEANVRIRRYYNVQATFSRRSHNVR